MKLGQVAELVKAKVLCGVEQLDREVSRAFAADLLSDVLAMVQEEGVLLITGNVAPQVIRVAEVMNVGAVLFVRGKYPNESSVQYAAEAGIPLLATDKIMFETCGILYAQGLLPAQRKRLPKENDAGHRTHL